MSKKTFKDNPALQFISDLPQQAESSEQPQNAKSWDDVISSPAPDQSTASSEEAKRVTAAPEGIPSKRDVPEGMKLNPLFVEKRTQRAQFVMQPSVYKKAKELAKARGISFNDFVHGLIEDEIERAGK